MKTMEMVKLQTSINVRQRSLLIIKWSRRMKISNAWGVFFACILVLTTLSVEAVESVAYLNDNLSLPRSETHQVTTNAKSASGKSRHSPAGGSLDVVFILSNALIGFLLLRRVNKK
jgi:hypothetical protein